MENYDIDPREPFPSEEDLAELEIIKDNLEDYFRDVEPDDLEVLNANEIYDYMNEDKEF